MKNIVFLTWMNSYQPRKVIESDIVPALRELCKITIGIVTGSDYDYVRQQIGTLLENTELDTVFISPCNGTKFILLQYSQQEYQIARKLTWKIR